MDGGAQETQAAEGASGSEYYQGEFVHHNVFSPTLIHTAGGKLRVNLNVRFPFGTDNKALTQALIELTEKHGGRVTNVISMPAVYVSKERPFLQAFAKSYEEGCGVIFAGALAKVVLSPESFK